jgi:phosphoribosylformimino-5-aminoimidazole carboxamide ribonucleotide (ProFAR) isomerase
VILYPAIDISDGKAVRLVQGDFDAETVYADSPLEAAQAWVRAGARYLHVVDLDGARTGAPQNLHHVERIAREVGVPVQVGGGLRSVQAVRDAVGAGATRVILGTAAFTDVDFLDEVVAEFAERTVVSVDTRGGFDHELLEEFFRAIVNNARITLHLEVQAGTNAHHMIEASFKAFARALRTAIAIDPTESGVPSTKGTLTA